MWAPGKEPSPRRYACANHQRKPWSVGFASLHQTQDRTGYGEHVLRPHLRPWTTTGREFPLDDQGPIRQCPPLAPVVPRVAVVRLARQIVSSLRATLLGPQGGRQARAIAPLPERQYEVGSYKL